MYKKFTYKQLFEVKTWFVRNLKKLYTNKRYTYLKEFLKDSCKYWNCVYFFEANSPIFKIELNEDYYTLSDEKEKIQINMSQEEINLLHNQLKNEKKLNKQIKENKTISTTLFDEFKSWEYEKIEWKPYLVYDIETVGNINNLRSMKFMIAYAVISNENQLKSIKYRLVDENAVKRFVDFMLDFDWWIIWYNNIYFDNPVSIYNTDYDDEKIDILNKKSIDLFLFIRNLTWKRIWLDKVSSSLLWIWKTLESWLEWEQYLKEYMQDWNQEAYKKVKSYCRNDVKMTLGVLLYFLKHNKIHIWEKEFNYNIKDIVKLWNSKKTKKDNNKDKNWQWIFDFDDADIKE